MICAHFSPDSVKLDFFNWRKQSHFTHTKLLSLKTNSHTIVLLDVIDWPNWIGPQSTYVFKVCCTLQPHELQTNSSHMVPWQTLVLTQDYEWESKALNLTVPKTSLVADTGIWPLPLLSFSRHPQALHNCLSASDKSRKQLGKKDKPRAPSAWLRAH